MAILHEPVYGDSGRRWLPSTWPRNTTSQVSRETVRQWMMGAKLWRARKQHIEKIHEWRPRRSRFGELVQWDTSDHDWLEGRGEEILLINMIDDATSRWFARFVKSDSTVENMNHLERYLKKHGRPLGFYTDKASLFQTAVKTKRDGSRKGKDREELPPTQIGRALQELGILGFIQIRAELANERVSGSGARLQTTIGERRIQQAEKAQTLDQIANEGIESGPYVRFSTCRGVRESSTDRGRRCGGNRRRDRRLSQCAFRCGGAVGRSWSQDRCGVEVPAGAIDRVPSARYAARCGG